MTVDFVTPGPVTPLPTGTTGSARSTAAACADASPFDELVTRLADQEKPAAASKGESQATPVRASSPCRAARQAGPPVLPEPGAVDPTPAAAETPAAPEAQDEQLPARPGARRDLQGDENLVAAFAPLAIPPAPIPLPERAASDGASAQTPAASQADGQEMVGDAAAPASQGGALGVAAPLAPPTDEGTGVQPPAQADGRAPVRLVPRTADRSVQPSAPADSGAPAPLAPRTDASPGVQPPALADLRVPPLPLRSDAGPGVQPPAAGQVRAAARAAVAADVDASDQVAAGQPLQGAGQDRWLDNWTHTLRSASTSPSTVPAEPAPRVASSAPALAGVEQTPPDGRAEAKAMLAGALQQGAPSGPVPTEAAPAVDVRAQVADPLPQVAPDDDPPARGGAIHAPAWRAAKRAFSLTGLVNTADRPDPDGGPRRESATVGDTPVAPPILPAPSGAPAAQRPTDGDPRTPPELRFAQAAFQSAGRREADGDRRAPGDDHRTLGGDVEVLRNAVAARVATSSGANADGGHLRDQGRAGQPQFDVLPVTAVPASVVVGQSTAAPSGGVSPQPAAPGSPVPLDVPQIVRAVRLQWQSGVGEARVQLHPEHLGQVTVELRVAHGAVVAAVHAETPAAREWIQNHQEDLKAALAQQGLQLDDLVVTADGERRDEPESREQPRRGPRGPRRAGIGAQFDIDV